MKSEELRLSLQELHIRFMSNGSNMVWSCLAQLKSLRVLTIKTFFEIENSELSKGIEILVTGLPCVEKINIQHNMESFEKKYFKSVHSICCAKNVEFILHGYCCFNSTKAMDEKIRTFDHHTDSVGLKAHVYAHFGRTLAMK